jgi:hypothetical protein
MSRHMEITKDTDMRYCTNCRHITIGGPNFCNSCGYSYDVKLCSSRHPNPRAARVCSQCGSTEFSTPAPPLSFYVRMMIHAFRFGVPAILGWLAIITLLRLIAAILAGELTAQIVAVILLIGAGYVVYILIADFLQDIFGHLTSPFRRRRPPRKRSSNRPH